MYRYYIYGLGIDSEVRLYHLEQYNGYEKDVYIRCGAVSENIVESISQGINSRMSKTSVWFRNDVGIFVISNGNEILIQPAMSATENDIASFILGWCIAFLFQQKEMLAIHCSALAMYNQAVFIAGGSGAGKSTLALSLLKEGFRYLADDIAMVDLHNDLMIQPAFPQQKICRNVAENMESDSLFYINERKDKFAFINNDDFCTEPHKLTTIFMLDRYDGKELIFEKTTGIAKWNGVVKNLFLLDAYLSLDFPRGERERCLELAGKVDMYTVRRPDGKDTLYEIRDRVIDVVKGKQII